MNTRIIDLLQSPEHLVFSDLHIIKEEIKAYPYMQSIRVLYLLGLDCFKHEDYVKELGITAAYTTDKRNLYHFINKDKNKSGSKNIYQEIGPEPIQVSMSKDINDTWKPMLLDTTGEILTEEKTTVNKNLSDIMDKHNKKNEEEHEYKKETLALGVSFVDTEKSQVEVSKNTCSNINSFINTWQKWLKIDRSEQKSEDLQQKKADIIDNFIQNNPKISPVKKDKDFVVREKTDDISHLMTETLAQIYVEQKLYTKAISAYEVLQEKFPEKSQLFAVEIENIKNLKQGK